MRIVLLCLAGTALAGAVGAQSAHPGMGSRLVPGGASFRVWAPHADAAWVAGAFGSGAVQRFPLVDEGGGIWSGDVAGAAAGHAYRYVFRTAGKELTRRDPYGRLVDTSDYATGNTILYDRDAFDWQGVTPPPLPPVEEMVIYELHVGTFAGHAGTTPGTFDDAIARIPHLVELGVNVVEVLPVTEFIGVMSGGYNPAEVFAVENRGYGGPDGFKRFVRACHAAGLSVFLDVVQNHLGPWDLTVHQFDGWSSAQWPGGIYFWDAARIDSPWGPRPNFAEPRVRRFLGDALRMWVDEYRVDGFRFDSTANVWNTDGGRGAFLPEGASWLQAVNQTLERARPQVFRIAEDLTDSDRVTAPVAAGGLGFQAQWHWMASTLRNTVAAPSDGWRDMRQVRRALFDLDGGQPWRRVVSSESHNEICCGATRLTVAIDPIDPNGWQARKRSTLAAAAAFCTTGIPMLYQGQEFLDQQPFDPRQPIDWAQKAAHPGIFALYRDLIAARLDRAGATPGLTGDGLGTIRVDNQSKLLAWQRFHPGGPSTVVVANFSSQFLPAYPLGLPAAGDWHVRFDSDDPAYAPDYLGSGNGVVAADGPPRDGFAQSGSIDVAPFTLLILSQDGD